MGSRSPTTGQSRQLSAPIGLIVFGSSCHQVRGRISSRQNAAKTEIARIVGAIETFYSQEARYPTTEEGLERLTEKVGDAFPNGILPKVPLDPWKRPYEYLSPGSTSEFEVICFGADGREGGEGENQDFSSESLDE